MLLRNLSQLGYLSHDPRQRTYTPTIRLVLLGSWLQRSQGDIAELAPRLADLQAQIGQMAYIGMQNGAAVQFVLVQDSDQPERLHIQSGQMRPIACSAAGRALLSLKLDHEVRGWVRRANAETNVEHHRVRESEILAIVANVCG
jgi:IclR family transcriptional regulator, KDG regulon repressor